MCLNQCQCGQEEKGAYLDTTATHHLHHYYTQDNMSAYVHHYSREPAFTSYWPRNVDPSQYQDYCDGGSLGDDFPGSDDNKEAVIQEIERNLADSVLAALGNQSGEAGRDTLNPITWGNPQPSINTSLLPQTYPTTVNGELYTPTTFSLPTPNSLPTTPTTIQQQQQQHTSSNDLIFKFTGDNLCPDYFSTRQNSPPVVTPPGVFHPKEEPVSPRPCSNVSASTHSQASGDDLMNVQFDNCYLTTSASSSEEGGCIAGGLQQCSDTGSPKAKRGGRKLRRQYSRDAGLSAAELQRRERRREQNRRAAEKCRIKNKAKNDTTIKEYQKLQSTNTTLQTQVKELEKQRQNLQDQLERHLAICPLNQLCTTTSMQDCTPSQHGLQP